MRFFYPDPWHLSLEYFIKMSTTLRKIDLKKKKWAHQLFTACSTVCGEAPDEHPIARFSPCRSLSLSFECSSRPIRASRLAYWWASSHICLSSVIAETWCICRNSLWAAKPCCSSSVNSEKTKWRHAGKFFWTDTFDSKDPFFVASYLYKHFKWRRVPS